MSTPSSQQKLKTIEPDVIHSVKSQVDIVREIELPMVHKRLDDLQHDVRENRQSIKDLSNKMDTNTWWIVGTIIFSVLIPVLIGIIA